MGRVLIHLIAIKGLNCLLVIVAGSCTRGRDSAVGIAARYSPRIESRCGRDFPHPSIPTLGPPNLLYNGYWVFPGGKATGAWL